MSLWKSLSKRSMLFGTGARVMCPNQSMNRNPGTWESNHRVVLVWWVAALRSLSESSTKWPTVKDIYSDLKCVVQYRIWPTPPKKSIATLQHFFKPHPGGPGDPRSLLLCVNVHCARSCHTWASKWHPTWVSNTISPLRMRPSVVSSWRKWTRAKGRNQLAEGDANAPNLDQRDCRCRSRMRKEKWMKNERRETHGANGMKLLFHGISSPVLSFASNNFLQLSFAAKETSKWGLAMILFLASSIRNLVNITIRFLISKSALLRN